jgi:hypothetical protein
MAPLRIFHEWAFRTEFKSLLFMTAIHSCIVFVLFALSFGNVRPSVLSTEGIAKCIGAVVVGGLTAVFATPFGFVLIMSGQAFITSGVATLLYVAVSALQGEQRMHPADPYL